MTQRLRYKTLRAATVRAITEQSESGRFEFKQNAGAVSAKVLTAAANTAALDGGDGITLYIGVEEVTDDETGLVSGRVIGVGNVERAKGQLTSRANETKPVPVRIRIVEENVSATPILVVTVWPTTAPHYDGNGSRCVRHGASTRPLTDEELLAMYMRREADRFRRTFEHIASGLQQQLFMLGSDIEDVVEEVKSEVGGIGHDIHNLREELGDDILGIKQAADEAAGHGEEANSEVQQVAFDLGVLRSEVEDVSNQVADLHRFVAATAPGLVLELRRTRNQAVAMVMGASQILGTKRALKIHRDLAALAEEPIDESDSVGNRAAIYDWFEVIKIRPASLKPGDGLRDMLKDAEALVRKLKARS